MPSVTHINLQSQVRDPNKGKILGLGFFHAAFQCLEIYFEDLEITVITFLEASPPLKKKGVGRVKEFVSSVFRILGENLGTN